jgi:predicted permease
MNAISRTAKSLNARLKSWIRAIGHRSRLEGEMDEELRFHLESYIEDLMQRGVPREQAMRRAKIEFGGMTVHKEEMRASLGLRLWDDLGADLRYALRMLWKSPGFTAIAVGSLALGIGANTAIFALAKQMLLDRLHVPRSEELRLLHWVAPEQNIVHSEWGDEANVAGHATSTSFPYPVYLQLREQNQKQAVLEDLFAFKDIGQVTATVDGEASVVQAEMVSGNYYRDIEVTPVLGRGITPGDDADAGSGAVVVISDGFWRRAFAASPKVIGKAIAINGKPFTVIGVNPPKFTGAKSAHESPQVFLPFSIQPVVIPRRRGSVLDEPGYWWLQIMARRKPGISREHAEAVLNAALASSVRGAGKVTAGEAIPQIQVGDGSRGMNEAARLYKQPIMVLTAVAGLVLLLACANIANLLLARASARQREMGVRLALGAGRGRVLRQMLTESLLLSLTGGAAGFVLGWASRDVIPRLMSQPWDPLETSAHVDWGVLGFTGGLSILTGLIFGLAPAWQSMRTQVSFSLKENAATVTRRRSGYSGKAIVVFQVALSTLLVIGAGLFLQTLGNLQKVNPGFRVDHLLLFEIEQPRAEYPAGADIRLHEEIARRLAAVPGVESVTSSGSPLIAGQINRDDFVPVGGSHNKNFGGAAFDDTVGNHFFATMGIPIIAGRDLNDGDAASSPKVALVNQAMAREAWGSDNPIGRQFRSWNMTFTVVGVAANTVYDSLRKEMPPQYFLPYRQTPSLEGGMTYEVRTHVDPASLTPLLRKAVAGVDRNLPLIAVRTQQQQIDATVGDERAFASLTAGFGMLALVLASIGIYGVMAYTVSRRTQEIGIRVAVGARTGQIVAMVLGETWRMAAIGVIAGVGLALLVTRLLKTMLYGLEPYDPATLVGAAALLCAVALGAGLAPARRASRVDPITALRHE